MKAGYVNPNHPCPQCGEFGVNLLLVAGSPVTLPVPLTEAARQGKDAKHIIDVGFSSSEVWHCRCTWVGTSADLERTRQVRSDACVRPLPCRCPACQALHGEIQGCLADDRRRGVRNGGGSGGCRDEKPGDKIAGGADQQKIADWEEDQRRRQRVTCKDPKSVVICVPGVVATSEEWEAAAALVAREAAETITERSQSGNF